MMACIFIIIIIIVINGIVLLKGWNYGNRCYRVDINRGYSNRVDVACGHNFNTFFL